MHLQKVTSVSLYIYVMSTVTCDKQKTLPGPMEQEGKAILIVDT